MLVYDMIDGIFIVHRSASLDLSAKTREALCDNQKIFVVVIRILQSLHQLHVSTVLILSVANE